MRIVLTGGGTGGHIFPLIAVAQALKGRAAERSQAPSIVVIGSCRRHRDSFEKNHIRCHHIITGKVRRNFSLQTLFDIPLVLIGLVQSYWLLLWYMPDVVFSKGGYGAFPVVVIAWLFRIPVVSHESDSITGLTNKILSRFTKNLLASFPSEQKDVIVVGNPVRDFRHTADTEALHLRGNRPVLFVMGGSQGASQINTLIFSLLHSLTQEYEIIHQVGKKNIREAQEASIELPTHLRKQYHFYDFLDENELKQAYAQCSLVVSRAGSGSLFEIALVGTPSILIPFEFAAAGHQEKNAALYEKHGACVVLNPRTVTAHTLHTTITTLMKDKSKRKSMSRAAHSFATPRATQDIVDIILQYDPLNASGKNSS